MELDLGDCPYSMGATGRGVLEEIAKLDERATLLRGEGTLNGATLLRYFGDTRFAQVAESNALEGSTLDIGETRLAVLQGVTVSGHDPAYSRDAVLLAAALDRLVELARHDSPTDLDQLREIHALLLGERPGAGLLRTERIVIRGTEHRPPRTWQEVMDAMQMWEGWSLDHTGLPVLLRAVVLHTWLTHIHPFIDGNGRAARAVLNLELIRAGLPSVIIRRRDRTRYLEALAESDLGGDLGPIAELIVERAGHALLDLERAAKHGQGHDQAAARMPERQQRQVTIYNDALRLLFSQLGEAAEQAFGDVGAVRMRWYDAELELAEYLALLRGDSRGNSWLFRIGVEVPAVGAVDFLAWTGFRSERMRSAAALGDGPSVFWSVPDPEGWRAWTTDDARSPGGAELTLDLPDVDRWIVRRHTGEIDRLPPSATIARIIAGLEDALG